MGKKQYRPDDPKIARNDVGPGKGYTKDNVAIVCNLVCDLSGQGDYDVGSVLGVAELRAFCARVVQGNLTEEDSWRIAKMVAATDVDRTLLRHRGSRPLMSTGTGRQASRCSDALRSPDRAAGAARTSH